MSYETSNPHTASTQAEPHVPGPLTSNVPLGMPDLELRYRAALLHWLHWNEAFEKATTHLFAAGQSPEKLEDFMDSMDQLRREAISMSNELLG